MTANVTVEIARADDVLRVPNAALRFRPDQATLRRRTASRPRPASRKRGARQVLGARATGGSLRADAASQVGVSDGTTTAIVGRRADARTTQVVTGVAARRPARGDRRGRR